MAILPIDNGRYGTKEMMDIFSEQKKVDYQLEIEGAAAISQSEIGMISKAVGKEIHRAATSGKITAKRIKQLEAKSDHDTAALVESLSEKCSKNARPWIHYGLTSNDLVDTSNSMQMRDALQIIEPKVARMASILAKKGSKAWKDSSSRKDSRSACKYHFIWIKVCKLGSRDGKTCRTNRGDQEKNFNL